MKCTSRKDLLSHAAGLLPMDRAAAVEAHARSCDSCASALGQLAATGRRLAPDPGEFDDPALADDVLTLIRLGRAPESPALQARRSYLWWAAPAAVAAVAAVLVFVLVLPPSAPPSDGFQTRSGADDPDRWVSIEAFRANEQGHYEPLGKNMGASDGLAFTYHNRSETFDHLMVLAVDEAGRIFWCYPAHTRPDRDPTSVSILSGAQAVQLPEQVQHGFAPGPLRLFALFSKGELRVKEIEAQVARDLDQAGSLQNIRRLSIPGTGQHSIFLTVEPAD